MDVGEWACAAGGTHVNEQRRTADIARQLRCLIQRAYSVNMT